MTHPLQVKGAASEKRWQQSQHELFRPLPMSIAFVGISTSGKSSQMLTVANILMPVMERIIIFSHSHRLDTAYLDIKEKLRAKALKRGENPDTHPVVYDNLIHLPKVLNEQRERVQELKDTGTKANIPQLLLILDDMLGEMNHSKALDAVAVSYTHLTLPTNREV